nr:MAG TPA: hypothetical protein [Caudoviricetes sp.]
MSSLAPLGGRRSAFYSFLVSFLVWDLKLIVEPSSGLLVDFAFLVSFRPVEKAEKSRPRAGRNGPRAARGGLVVPGYVRRVCGACRAFQAAKKRTAGTCPAVLFD